PARAVPQSELPKLTGMIESLTFVAILGGSLIGGALVYRPSLLILLVVGCAVLGIWLATRLCPMPAAVSTEVAYHDSEDTKRCRRLISWFWFLGASYLTQLGLLARELMAIDATQVSYCLAAFALGVSVGSPLAARLYQSHRLGWIGLIVLGLALPVLAQFDWRLGLAGLAGLGVAGGLYVVPIYVRLQTTLTAVELPQAIALNNRLNAVYMIASAVAGMALLGVLQITPRDYFWLLALSSLLVAPGVIRFDRHRAQHPDQT
ncbi:MAG: hypothetical protein ACPGUF_04510, partial [Litorivicinus sp.]